MPNGPGFPPQPPCEIVGGDTARGELRVGGQRRVHRHGGRHSAELAPGQRIAQPGQRLRPAGPADDELGQQAVVLRRHRRARLNVRVDPDARPGREDRAGHGARAGPEPGRRVFRVDPALDRVAAQADIGLGQPEPAPLRDRDLLRHQVEPGDRLGHRVLHLDARVHLEEPERGPFGVHQEFDGAQALVLQVQAEGDRRRTHADPQRLAEPRRRRLLDELLIPPLHRAVPVAEVDHVLPVAKQLHLDVPRGGDVPLQVHPRIGERRLRLGAGHRDRFGEPARIADHPQPPPAAASRRLDQHRIPDGLCQPGRVRGVGHQPAW